MSDTQTEKSPSTLDTGMVLKGKWVILELIGKGGMGEVYRAHQLNLKRDVAIKVISHHFLQSINNNKYELESSLERFRREVQVMAQVSHPNVLQIYDQDSATIEKNGETVVIDYIAMEYIPGGMTLRDTMSEEGFYPDEEPIRHWLRTYFLPLLDGMKALHELGIVHRDLKPENILLDEGQPKIADFGLARSCRLKPITQSIDIKGTPPYMSPEHFMDLKRTDERTDVYALGKILYEAAAGRMGSNQIPFKRAQLIKAESPFFRQLDQIIQNATAEERNERTESVTVLADQIRNLVVASEQGLDGNTKTAGKRLRGWKRHTALWGLAALVIGGIVALGMMSFHERAHNSPLSPPASTTTPLSSTGESPQLATSADLSTEPPQRVRGFDYDLMHRIPGGTLVLPADFGADAGKTVEIKPFYMNEALITNQQYVNFLNAVRARVKVADNVVRGDGRIWLMLGEVIKDYEPIVYRDGRFYVKNALHTACPVVRVTAYGAKAYVDHYGLRLPTEQEWLYVATKQAEASAKAVEQNPWRNGETWMMNEMMGGTPASRSGAGPDEEKSYPIHTPVTVFKPNAYGLRGINKNLGEWTTRLGADQKEEYVIMGWPSAGHGNMLAGLSGIRRNPWEAFEEAGFRCVADGEKKAAQDRSVKTKE